MDLLYYLASFLMHFNSEIFHSLIHNKQIQMYLEFINDKSKKLSRRKTYSINFPYTLDSGIHVASGITV